MSMLRVPERGMTLTEVLIASALGVVVIIALYAVDNARFRIYEDLRKRSAVGSETYAALAALHIAKHLERADRLNIPSSGVLQVRIPACAKLADPVACLNDPTKYQWDQYRLNAAATELDFFINTGAGCGTRTPLAGQITALSFTYKDEVTLRPPGGEPANQDNNVVKYALTWANGPPRTGRTHVFGSEVTSRAIPYSDVGVTGNESGCGLLPCGPPIDPPSVCP